MLIIIFFIFSTVSTILAGLLLPRLHRTVTTKAMGWGLFLTGIAFGVWSAAVIAKPAGDSLNFWISAGAAVYIGALLFFTRAAVSKLQRNTQQLLTASVAVYAVVLWFVRLALPSNPGFSTDGLFYFQPSDIVSFMYIVLMAAVVLHAVQLTSEDIRESDKTSAQTFSIALVSLFIGGVLLLVGVMDVQDTLMYLVGWGMAIAQFILLLTVIGVFRSRKKRSRHSVRRENVFGIETARFSIWIIVRYLKTTSKLTKVLGFL